MMLDATTITTEDELNAALARCGFASTSASNTPGWIWVPWTWGWKGGTVPLARALSSRPYEGFIVAIQHGAFQVYELDQQNDWYHLVGEIQGDVSEQELTEFFRIATMDVPFVERSCRSAKSNSAQLNAKTHHNAADMYLARRQRGSTGTPTMRSANGETPTQMNVRSRPDRGGPTRPSSRRRFAAPRS
jgi:hypothetical protein